MDISWDRHNFSTHKSLNQSENSKATVEINKTTQISRYAAGTWWARRGGGAVCERAVTLFFWGPFDDDTIKPHPPPGARDLERLVGGTNQVPRHVQRDNERGGLFAWTREGEGGCVYCQETMVRCHRV